MVMVCPPPATFDVHVILLEMQFLDFSDSFYDIDLQIIAVTQSSNTDGGQTGALLALQNVRHLLWIFWGRQA